MNATTVAASSAIGAILFFVLSADWSVAGLAFGHSFGFLLGTGVLAFLLARRLDEGMSMWWSPALARALLFGSAAAGLMWLTGTLVPDDTKGQALGNLLIVSLIGMVVYGGLMLWAKSPELLRVTTVVRRRRS